ncbi:MAG TPA: TIM-barrel domain-containing protein [Terracidiphilus sp.]|nr:TIM-barrel domain-containing protein [Terracidiphilus sp.]
MVEWSRRSVLGGLGAGVAEVLLHTRVSAAATVAGLTGKPGALDLRLAAISPRVLHISIAPVSAAPPMRELGVVAHPGEQTLGKDPGEGSRQSEIHWGAYRIRVEQNPLRLTVTDADKRVRQQIQFDTDSTAVRFLLGSRPLFGLGEGIAGLDLRGKRVGMRNGESSPDLQTSGARLPIPWLISAEGWGLFVGQPMGLFDLTGAMGVAWPSAASSTRNVYLVLGDSPAEVMRGYAELTGFSHLPPLWSLGYMQSHRTLASREEVMGIAETFREKKLPCDALIYLGTGFCPSGWNTGHGSFTFNADVFPDPPEMIRQMHQEHMKVVLHVVPPYDLHGKITDTGETAHVLGDAAPYWAEHMPLEEIGVDGWWPDEGDGLAVDERLERNQLYWDGQRQAHPDQRPFALHRNGYAGLQRFGWLWSGDTDSTWETLAAQVLDGINVGLCGIPYWGTDTGGFVPTHELTPELYVRWFQFSAFCPLFRSHGRAWKLRLPWGWNMGTPGPLEGSERLGNWPRPQDLHDARVEPICRKFLNLRYQLLPYIYSSVEQTHRTGLPLMRALWMDWPQDAKSLQTADAYMLGDSLLVAPVMKPGAVQRTSYLPAGSWWDFWTNQRVQGGGEVTRAVDLETLPLYVRAGAVVPMGPVRQYAAEPSDEPVTLRVYPGVDGRSSWYEDDGISLAYERGKCTRIECYWSDAARKLTLAWGAGSRTEPGKKVRVQAMDTGAVKLVTLGRGATGVKL